MGTLEGEGPWAQEQPVSSSVLMPTGPCWAPADEEPPDFRNPGLRWAQGQAEQPCPACPQEPLGSAQATSLPALEQQPCPCCLPGKSGMRLQQLAPPPSRSKQALHWASASSQEAPEGGHDLHTMGKTGPAHSSRSRPRAPRWGGAAPAQQAWTQQALFDTAITLPVDHYTPPPPPPAGFHTWADPGPALPPCRAETDLVCVASPPSQLLRRSWYPWPPQTGVTQGCSECLLSRLSPAGVAAASRRSQESM